MLRKSMEMFLLYFFSWFCIYFLKRKTNINMKKCCLGYSKTSCLNWTEQKFYAKFQHAPNKKNPHLQSGHYDFLNGIFFCTWNQKSQRGSMRYLQCTFLFKFLFFIQFPKISTLLHEEGEIQTSFFLFQGEG